MKVKNAVICAAGLGSRLGLNVPKCLVPIGSKKLIYYLLQLVKDIENVHIVVGYKEEEVINYVRSIRNDIVFVRNPNYNTTSNSHSLYLGTKDFTEPYLTIDGDMILEQAEFDGFVNAIDPTQDLIGVSKAKTDDAVFTKVNEKGELVEFNRERIDEFEWCGIAYFVNVQIQSEANYIYEQIIPHLPLKSYCIECWEIDTPNDLNLALNEISFIE